MQVDSMHACTQRASKAVDVYLPRDWAFTAATAKKTGKPYSIMQMTSKDTFDFKAVASKLISKTVVTRKIKHLQNKFCFLEECGVTWPTTQKRTCSLAVLCLQ